ncbi:MAG: hypothetical protein WCA20_01765 [Candidatus Sulfotelmatobacter sp.]
MRERALIHVAGPPGSGKTTFVEAILSIADWPVLVARCIRDDALRRERETESENHPELRRYRQAGASGVALFVFPGNIAWNGFFLTKLMEDYSRAVFLEGDSPFEFVDFRVFVAPAPQDDETLFVWRTRHLAAGQRGRAAISQRYVGIERAQLVVVNVRSEYERKGGEQIVADVVQLRKDKELYDDILGFRRSKLPITAVVANLNDPHDPGRKKALARVRRALRSRAA